MLKTNPGFTFNADPRQPPYRGVDFSFLSLFLAACALVQPADLNGLAASNCLTKHKSADEPLKVALSSGMTYEAEVFADNIGYPGEAASHYFETNWPY